jgi:hypothetical protein
MVMEQPTRPSTNDAAHWASIWHSIYLAPIRQTMWPTPLGPLHAHCSQWLLHQMQRRLTGRDTRLIVQGDYEDYLRHIDIPHLRPLYTEDDRRFVAATWMTNMLYCLPCPEEQQSALFWRWQRLIGADIGLEATGEELIQIFRNRLHYLRQLTTPDEYFAHVLKQQEQYYPVKHAAETALRINRQIWPGYRPSST